MALQPTIKIKMASDGHSSLVTPVLVFLASKIGGMLIYSMNKTTSKVNAVSENLSYFAINLLVAHQIYLSLK
jgi:hypothetical protein